MLTFLRRIRRSLIESGSARKYLLYAIGEIALVVIGILIALQINNWNEVRKDNLFEIKMIKEIVTALEGDSTIMDIALKPRVALKIKGINALLNLAALDTTVHNSIIMSHYTNMRTGSHMSFNYGPYEALKANGLEKIKNDSIRLLIVGIYEFAYPRQSKFYHKIEILNVDAISLAENELFENIIYGITEKTREVKRIPKDVSFLQNSRLLDIIRMEQEDANEKQNRLMGLIRFNKHLLGTLRNYINTVENYD